MTQEIQEELFDIPGYEGLYAATKSGKIYSYPKRTSNKYGRFLAQSQTHGYQSCSLNGKTNKVHRLIALTFLKNPQNLPTVNHKNGNKTDNRVENLEWMTVKDNIRHAVTNGMFKCIGQDNIKSKLNNNKVIKIMQELQKNPCNQIRLAKKYNVTTETISAINRGKTWRHLFEKAS